MTWSIRNFDLKLDRIIMVGNDKGHIGGAGKEILMKIILWGLCFFG